MDDALTSQGDLPGRDSGQWQSLPETTPLATSGSYSKESKQPIASRREFVEWVGALTALLGTSACTRQPVELILPYTKAPELIVAGKPLFFATTMTMWGTGVGCLVESHMGRPTKIEGNPDHPASLGSTDLFMQASILDLYDPDRAQSPTYRGTDSSWPEFARQTNDLRAKQSEKQGAGLRILTEGVVSPTLEAQIASLLEKFPKAKWIEFDSLCPDRAREASRLAFGDVYDVEYRLASAKVIAAFESNFLVEGPGCIRYARDFSSGRKTARAGAGINNRLYVFESSPSSTGSIADHRFNTDIAELDNLVGALAHDVGLSGFQSYEKFRTPVSAALAADLKANRGESLVVGGPTLSPQTGAILHAINSSLGNTGRTVVFRTVSALRKTSQLENVKTLIAEMKRDEVDVLLSLGGNPVRTVPENLDFVGAIEHVKVLVQLSAHIDETARHFHWHLPESHYLETWSDARSFEGSHSLVQPLIAPLYSTKSRHEIISLWLGESGDGSYLTVQNYWKKTAGTGFDLFWRRALHDGVIKERAVATANVGLKFKATDAAAETPAGLTLAIRPDPSVNDGRFSNNPWLQELSKPITKLTWENALLVSPALASQKGLRNGDVVELNANGKKVAAGVWILPGQAPTTVTLTLGYGRTSVGRVGNAIGVSAEKLRTEATYWNVPLNDLKKTGAKIAFACTQTHFSMEGRDIVRWTDLLGNRNHKEEKHEAHEAELPEHRGRPFEDKNYAWGMAIDLSLCNGCNACVVACQAENNIPVVGKDQVGVEREMQWIRIDRYFEGDANRPKILQQPVICMHCEKAPCEVVCPVAATTHSPEGINEMTYNRCVGTKYCSNNCPYKVRRFNFFQYTDRDTPSLKLQRNPDVTVRSRGVMEKCTYCVQRVNGARITAKKEDRLIRDGDIVTACQSACPSQAITFGNVKDKQSQVSQWKASDLNYGLLEELGTKPRTTYLARVSNPNPALESAPKPEHPGQEGKG